VSIRTFPIALVGSLLLAGPVQAQSPTVPSVLSDRTGLCLLVGDVSHLRQHIGESPLAALWQEEISQGTAGPSSFVVLRIQAACGLSVPAIFNHFDGEAALVLPQLRYLVAADDDAEWAFVAASSSDAPWKQLDKDLKSGKPALGTSRSTKTMHVFVSGRADSSLAWTWSKGIGFLASSPHVLAQMIAARNAASHLDQTENWRSLEARTARGDMTLYVDLEDVPAWLRERMAGNRADSLGAMMGVTPVSMVSALNLEAFHAVRVTAALDPEETRIDAALGMQAGPGLPRLLAYLPGPCPRPSIIPADAVFASVSRFRLADFWQGLLDMLDRVGPGMSMFAKAELQKVALTAGLDFEKDILSNLGDETFLAYLPRRVARPDSIAGTFDQLSGVRIKDPAKMLKVVSALVELAPGGGSDETTEARPKERETRLVRGIPVTSVQFGPEESGSVLSYAVLDSTLLVAMGEGDILARALEARAKGASFWTRADLAPLLGSISPDACTINYWDPSGLQAPETAPAEHRFAAMKLLERFGPSLAYTEKIPEGYLTHVRLRRAAP
jgi:hypothetical protein